ncbi:alpha-amylase family glycosyl hydrolase [Chitinophagaceae bacterium LB-8]|uniref:Alpha-amylase family glycosyl hydrolase n=1 Tax=Paraflavisolibacter caeni TaxID=2982496 RepID=A0A9X2XZ48_9BACT|nr:alpha-amylase family glycosyl hydrolase [Paraflavisolibacter caeni]MCU7551880.1 alpha-amylase family glycosyl hydrolase [Paraflavisolibacter caeni]
MAQQEMHHWWQTGIIYEVYVRSFQDSNGDGIGDIQGIIQRLDYLQWLGVTAIWVTPVFPSPMKDLGYDISDYTGIHPLFGSMSDFDELLRQVHNRGMKLIIDFVPNHTSDQHPWFIESCSSKENPKRDWYYWYDAKPGGNPPNNWLSVLGGSAWEWDKRTGQYYYHAFLKEQPDLNLWNPEVQQEIKKVMQFWLDKGVDGLRIDVMWHLAKDEKLRDNPINPGYKPEMPDCDQLLQIYSCDQPEVHDVVHFLREVIDDYKDKVMLGEIYLPIHRIVPYYGSDNKGAHLPGNFQLLFLPWQAQQIGIAIDQYEAALPDQAWPNWVIGNHDRSRLIERIGDAQSKVAALLLLTLRGTPIMYYGDEIGMRNVPIPKEEWQDPQGLLMPDKNLSRDPQRTPMQWNVSAHAGFTTGKPWLRLDENFLENNVELQKHDPNSLLCFYKRLIQLRQEEPSLQTGDYYPVITDNNTLAYIRRRKDEKAFLIVLNLTGEPKIFKPKNNHLQGKVIFSTINKNEHAVFKAHETLEANEALVVLLDA